MSFKLLKGSSPKRILLFSLSNIGDVILTCPVIDIIRRDFPHARLDVLIGPKAFSLFADNPNFFIRIFNKKAGFAEKCAWFFDLFQEHYDVVIDLRSAVLSLFLAPRYASPVLAGNAFKGHMKDRHLDRLRQVYEFDSLSDNRYAIVTTKEDERFFESDLRPLLGIKDYIVIAPGTADSAKRWDIQGFAQVADRLSMGKKIVFVGDDQDVAIVNDIQSRMKATSISLAGKINLRQLAYVLKKCSWALTHDSGVMHLASYFDVSVLVLWGPTDLDKYGPWSSRSLVVRRHEKCLRCQDPSIQVKHICMSLIQVDDVLQAAEKMQ